MGLAGRGVDEQGGDEVIVVPVSPAAGGPGFLRELPGGALLPDDGLHHLADEAVRQDNDGVAVLVGNVKGLLDHVHRLGPAQSIKAHKLSLLPGKPVLLSLQRRAKPAA